MRAEVAAPPELVPAVLLVVTLDVIGEERQPKLNLMSLQSARARLNLRDGGLREGSRLRKAGLREPSPSAQSCKTSAVDPVDCNRLTLCHPLLLGFIGFL